MSAKVLAKDTVAEPAKMGKTGMLASLKCSSSSNSTPHFVMWHQRKHLSSSWHTMCTLNHPIVSNSLRPLTVAHQAPVSMRFPRQEYWSGLPFPPPGDLPNPGRLNPQVLCLLHRRQILYCQAIREASIFLEQVPRQKLTRLSPTICNSSSSSGQSKI